MIRSSVLRLLLLFSLSVLGLSLIVHADETSGLADETLTPSGFLDFTDNYFNGVAVISPSSDESDVQDEVIEVYPDVALMSVSPEDIDNGSLEVFFDSYLDDDDTFILSVGPFSTSSALNNVRTSSALLGNLTTDGVTETISITMPSTSDAMYDAGQIFSFSLSDIEIWYDSRQVFNSSASDRFVNYYGNSEILKPTIYIYDSNGTKSELQFQNFIFNTSSSAPSRFYLSFTSEQLPFDIYQIDIEFKYSISECFGMPLDLALGNADTNTYNYFRYHTIGFYNSVLNMKEVEQTTGLLSSIIDFLASIRDNILGLPGLIVNGIKDIFLNLFVIEQPGYEKWQDKFDEFFSEHFGFVYQGATVIGEIYITLTESIGTVQPTISFPEFTYDFGEGAVFTFGGYDVRVVPEGFEGLVQTLKLILNIVFTLAFVNVALKYFDRFLNR